MISRALAKWLDAHALASYREGAGGDCFLEHLPDAPDEAVQILSDRRQPAAGRCDPGLRRAHRAAHAARRAGRPARRRSLAPGPPTRPSRACAT